MEYRVAKAKLFIHGQSRAVRLPKEFQFEGTDIDVRRTGNELVLSSKANSKTSMQPLVEALDEFESGLQLAREQPEHNDQRAPAWPPQGA